MDVKQGGVETTSTAGAGCRKRIAGATISRMTSAMRKFDSIAVTAVGNDPGWSDNQSGQPFRQPKVSGVAKKSIDELKLPRI
jgi:hypothetical protein